MHVHFFGTKESVRWRKNEKTIWTRVLGIAGVKRRSDICTPMFVAALFAIISYGNAKMLYY
jgi:hypothetical protein